MDWKRRHTAATLLIALAPVLMNIGAPISFLIGSLIGGVLTGGIVVYIISAPVQWLVHKVRHGGKDEPGNPPTPEAAD